VGHNENKPFTGKVLFIQSAKIHIALNEKTNTEQWLGLWGQK